MDGLFSVLMSLDDTLLGLLLHNNKHVQYCKKHLFSKKFSAYAALENGDDKDKTNPPIIKYGKCKTQAEALAGLNMNIARLKSGIK